MSFSTLQMLGSLYTQYVNEHELYQQCNMLPGCYIELKYAHFAFFFFTMKLRNCTLLGVSIIFINLRATSTGDFGGLFVTEFHCDRIQLKLCNMGDDIIELWEVHVDQITKYFEHCWPILNF